MLFARPYIEAMRLCRVAGARRGLYRGAAMADAPILVTATFAPGDDGWLQELRRTHYPPALNRVPAHLTLLRLLPPSAEGELCRRLAAASP